jgi:hypothetical protein
MLDPRDDVMEVYSRQGDVFRRLGAYKPQDTFQSPILDATIVDVGVFFDL